MPRPGPRRPLVAVRLSDEEITAVDALADRRGVSRSDVIRAAIRREFQRETRRARTRATGERNEQ